MTETKRSVHTVLSRGPCGDVRELSARYLEEYLSKIEASVAELDSTAIWWRPNGPSNSIGNLLLHLAGNLSMWILQGLGGQPFERHRQAEFERGRNEPTTRLLAELARVVAQCRTVIEQLPAEGMTETVRIQAYHCTRLDALLHAVEHMSYHTGQIVWIAKLHGGEAGTLEFYPQHRDE